MSDPTAKVIKQDIEQVIALLLIELRCDFGLTLEEAKQHIKNTVEEF